jgi:tetratricopeptide (TPR) repeat protein
VSVSEFERKRCEKLAERGFELVEEGKCDEAIAVADELEVLRYTAGFEIRALSLAKLGRKEEAVETLESGVEKAPTLWLLWQLLGNYRSDLGRFDEAQEAYARALGCPGADVSSVHLNRAIALARQERNDEAWKELELVTDPALQFRRECSRVGLLLDAKRLPEAVRLAQELLGRHRQEQEHSDVLGAVQADLAIALHRMGASRHRVMTETCRALELHKGCQSALWLLRELNYNVSKEASYYRLLLQGPLGVVQRRER